MITTHTSDAFRAKVASRLEELISLMEQLRELRAQTPKTHMTLRLTLDELLKTLADAIPDIRFDALHADACACGDRLCKDR